MAANKYASIVQSGVNNYLTSAETLNGPNTDNILPGVVGRAVNTSGVAPATGSFAVNAQGSPNMTVAVSAGQAYVSATPTSGNAQTVRVTSDASENVTIAANSTGSTRYDFVYIKVDPDKMNNPAVTGTDVVTLIVQRSTAITSDSNGVPTNSLLLAIVTVANGASSISNSNIQDVRIRTSFHGDGWTYANETWIYASATTITVPTDATFKYSVGDKIRLVQSGAVKYFYITGVAATTLTINGGTDYTLANATILQPCFAKVSSPQGFPQWFNYLYTLAASGGGSPTVGNGTTTGTRFCMNGKTVHVQFKLTLGTTTSFGTGELQISFPVTAASTVGNNMHIGSSYIIDVSASQDYNAWVAAVSASAFRIDCVNSAAPARISSVSGSGSVPFAWATSDQINGLFTYEAA